MKFVFKFSKLKNTCELGMEPALLTQMIKMGFFGDALTG